MSRRCLTTAVVPPRSAECNAPERGEFGDNLAFDTNELSTIGGCSPPWDVILDRFVVFAAARGPNYS
jgi:hypothetical protein